MRHIAIITARSGSKGIINKNIKKINGKPMMAYTIEAALQSRLFDRIMVSTDSEEYADIAIEYGAEVPFLRSNETSGDSAGSWDVVQEVLDKYYSMGDYFDTVCLLQPTSPLRTGADIIAAYDYFNKIGAEAVTSVCECDHPAEYMMVLPKNNSLKEYRKHEVDVPRQMLPTYYRINGAIYVRSIKNYNKKVEIVFDDEYAFIMDKMKSVDIDTIEDFEYAEYLLNKKV